jgi:hypothetical protein
LIYPVILQDARLWFDVPQMSHKQFAAAYVVLAKRDHPNGGLFGNEELMKNINAAQTKL